MQELMIPKHRFDEVNEERKRLENELAELREAAKEAEGLREEINRLKKDSAVERAIAEANAINPDTVNPLLNLPDEYDDDFYGVVKEQLGRLAADEQTAFLFKSEEKPCLKGFTPDESCDGLPEQRVLGLDAAIKKHMSIN